MLGTIHFTQPIVGRPSKKVTAPSIGQGSPSSFSRAPVIVALRPHPRTLDPLEPLVSNTGVMPQVRKTIQVASGRLPRAWGRPHLERQRYHVYSLARSSRLPEIKLGGGPLSAVVRSSSSKNLPCQHSRRAPHPPPFSRVRWRRPAMRCSALGATSSSCFRRRTRRRCASWQRRPGYPGYPGGSRWPGRRARWDTSPFR
jgi:hypothetical protein